jgi:hypothetical protein
MLLMTGIWQVLQILGFLMIFQVAPGQKIDWGGVPATVTLHIIDTYCTPIKYKVETFHDVEDPGTELAGKFDGLTFKGATTFKTYEFRLVPLPQPRVFPAFKQRITVLETHTFALFAVPETIVIPDMDLYPVTRLILRPAPVGKWPIWVTVRALFLPQVDDLGSETVAVDPGGSFVLHGLHGGRYVVTVCQDDKVLGTAVVDLPLLGPREPIEIRLR